MPISQQELFLLRQAGFNVADQAEIDQLNAQEREALQQAQQELAQPDSDIATPASIALSEGEDGEYQVKAAEQDEGFFTRLGNTVDDVLSGRHRAEGFRQFAPDIPIKSDEEAEQERVDRLDAARRGEGNLLSRGLAYTAAGVEVTADAAVDLTFNAPATVGAWATNQKAPWLNPPAVIKDDDAGKTMYSIVQVVAPSVAMGVAAAPLLGAKAATATGVAATLVGESAVETTLQRSADDLVMGRTQAIKLGELANSLGYDGNQLTTDLIEGRKPNARALIAVLGFAQNLTFNVGGMFFFKALGKGFKGVRGLFGDRVAAAARVTGNSPEAVAKSLTDVNMPKGTALDEPHEMVDLDSAVSAAKPSKGRTFVNDDALVDEILRRPGMSDAALTAGDRTYFTNMKSLADEAGIQRVLKESTDTLRRLREFPEDMGAAMLRAQDWWQSNRALIDIGDYETLARNFLEGEFIEETAEGFVPEFVENVVTRPYKGGDLFKEPTIERILKEYAVTNEEGFIAAALVGEEMGVRIQRLARQAMNLDDKNINFEKVIDQIIDLHETAHQFLIPLRRGKRASAVNMTLQQRRMIRGVKDADIKGALRRKKPVTATDESRLFQTISTDGKGIGRTPRELWDAWKTGDQEAGDTLKAYLGLISYGEGVDVLAQVDNLTRVLEKQLAGATEDAQKQLWYSYLVSRIRPQQASLSSNLFNILRVPIGELIQGNNARGIGQVLGGLGAWNEAWHNAARAFKHNRSFLDSTGEKFNMGAKSLAAKNQTLDSLYEGVRREMNARNAPMHEKFFARMHYLQQRLANAPGQKLYSRLFTAQDEWAKTMHGAQIATGRAWERHAADKTQDLAKIVSEEMDRVFQGGVATGKIVDEDVLRSARELTFQAPIPRGENANQVDKMFSWLADAAEDSAGWNFVSPFTKLSWNSLEQSGRMMAGALDAVVDVPVKAVTFGQVSAKPSHWIMSRMRRYSDILKLPDDHLDKQRLMGDLAFAEGWAVSAAAMASLGGVTGNNPPEGYPRMSFIIPAPGTKKGWVAVSYERIDPVAMPTAIIADLVQGLKNGDLTTRKYERGMKELLTSVLTSAVDKSFVTGLREASAFFDVRNLSENGLARSGTSLAMPQLSKVSGAYGGLARMIAEWVNPYQGITKDEENSMTSFWSALSQRQLGGIGTPKLYDPLSGKPLLKNGVFESDNIFVNMIGQGLSETFIPGRSQRGENKTIYSAMELLGYEWSPRQLVSNVDGVSLSPQGQSDFSMELHTYGKLNERLEQWTRSNRGGLQALQAAINNGNSTRVIQIRNELNKTLTETINNVKVQVANNAPLTSKAVRERKLAAYQQSGVGLAPENPAPKAPGRGASALDQANYIINAVKVK